MLTKLEIKLFNYLKKNPKVILDSLDDHILYCDKKTWEIYHIAIENEKIFNCWIKMHKDAIPHISCLPIPKDFLRKEKLKTINENK